MAEVDVRKIIENCDQVLKRFTPVFLPGAVGKLDENDFREFLSFEHNRHWSSLERQNNRLCKDMDTLRKTLAVLVDEDRPINRRVDDTLQLHGMGIATLSAILLVAYPNSYGVWNRTSEVALRHLGLWPSTPRGASTGDKYAAVNLVLVEVANRLGISLWTLDALWWGYKPDGTGTAASLNGHRNRSNDGPPFSSKKKSIWIIKNTVLHTAKYANGQTVATTVKNKALLMSELELEALVEELLDAGDNCCAISGLPFEFEGDGDNVNMRPSLDRIDSDGHYEASNLQLVCRFINFWKRDTPDEEFRHLIQAVRDICKADIGNTTH